MGQLEIQDSFAPYFDSECDKSEASAPQARSLCYRARSATRASSTTMPEGVARRFEFPTDAIRPSS